MRTAHRRGEGNAPWRAWTRGHGAVFERTGVLCQFRTQQIAQRILEGGLHTLR
jgi:hypothetical protein